MAESKLRELSMEFSVDIINLVKFLKSGEDAKDNVKYMSKDGKSEVVINFTDKENPKIVTDPYNRGTYNFADYRTDIVGH